MKRIAVFVALLLTPLYAGAQYAPPAAAAYFSPSDGVWNPLNMGAAFGALGYTPPAMAMYCQTSPGGPWTPCNFSGGGGGGLPTATIGQVPAATGTGTTYQAINISKIPVEFYGATPYTSEAAAEAGPDDTAKFQSAVTAAVNGLATCQAGYWYHVEGQVNFISNEGLVGTSNQTYGGLCNLVSNSATSHILSAVGTSGAYLAGITVANLSIHRSTAGTGTSAGIYSSFNGGMIVQNVLSYDSVYDFYRHASPGFGIGYWMYLQAGWLLNESSGTYYGFYDDSADGHSESSIILAHSAVACQNLTGSAVSYGQILTGEAVNDNDSFDFNTGGCSYGQVVNYTGSGGSFASNDIHFYGSTHDGIGISCYKISNTSLATDGYVEINGGHCNSSVSGGALVDIESSYGVKVAGVNINQHDGFGASHALYAANSSNIIWANNTVTNFGTATATNTPLEWTGVTNSAATGNTVYAYSANAGNIFWVTGNSTHNSITGNSLSGYSTAGNGIGISVGSNNNSDGPNSIDTTHITSGTAVSDGGTGNGIYGNFYATASGTNSAVQATSPTGTAVGAGGVLTIGGRNIEGWNSATPTATWSLGFYTPNTNTGSGIAPSFYVYGGTSWQTAWSVNASTLAMTFAGAVTAPSYSTSGGRKGTFVCTAGGTITIANTNELATSDVIISLNTAGGTISTAPAMKTVTAGTGFTVLCGASDTSTYNYDILN